MEILNGQLWKQPVFPLCDFVALLVPFQKDRVRFCRVDPGTEKEPPLIMTEEDGKWIYTEAELQYLIVKLGYELQGSVYMDLKGGLNEQTSRES